MAEANQQKPVTEELKAATAYAAGAVVGYGKGFIHGALVGGAVVGGGALMVWGLSSLLKKS